VFDWNWDEAGVASREIIATNGRLDAYFRAAIFSKG
jgi:hypothetical protein